MSGDLEKDAYSVQLFTKEKMPLCSIQSFAKNFGLYGHRVGCFSMPNEDEEFVKSMNEFLGSRIRKMYSTNSRYGSDIVRTILDIPELK